MSRLDYQYAPPTRKTEPHWLIVVTCVVLITTCIMAIATMWTMWVEMYRLHEWYISVKNGIPL